MIKAADMDGDGDMDLITISENDDELIWFENTGSTVDIKGDDTNQPLEFGLHQNFPNPFNPSTKIKYSIPNAEALLNSSQHVTLKVYDVLGNEIAELINESKPAGNYEINFDASELASGIYFYRIHAGSFSQVKKMILLR
jgi:hypothetical protein